MRATSAAFARRARTPAWRRPRARRRAARPRTRAARGSDGPAPGRESSSDGNTEDDLAGHAQRLAARRQDRRAAARRGAARRRAPARAEHVLAVVEHEQHLRAMRATAITASTRPRPEARGGRARRRRRPGPAAASPTGELDHAAPASIRLLGARASSRASLVFPAPPVPKLQSASAQAASAAP